PQAWSCRRRFGDSIHSARPSWPEPDRPRRSARSTSLQMAKLSRSIGLTQATAMVVGTIVGASIFVQPSEVSRALPGITGILLVWVTAGALTWVGASICAELTS